MTNELIDEPETNAVAGARERALLVVAAVVGLLGLGILVASLYDLSGVAADYERSLLLLVLATAAMVCARVPIKLGVGQAVVLIDSIPLVLAALLLPWSDAVLVAVATLTVGMIGQPSLPGRIGAFWRVQAPLAAGLAMAITSWVAQLVVGAHTPGIVLAGQALVVAAVLDIALNAAVVLELESDERGSGLQVLEAWPTIAANVFLPTAAAAMLTPYLAESIWLFVLLLPVLLVAMYGALWIANSQQLEKRRSMRLHDTFSRYVPEGIVDDNLETMQKVELGGEQRELSVLFCDVRGFTSWSESKQASEVITELNVLLGELSASVMSTGGTLDKFTGDGLMAFWGAPVPVEDHAERACRAAQDMLVRLDALNERRIQEGHEPFAMGVAVHTGPAVVGNVGHERRLDYTAIGDTVNTAARLEAATKDIGSMLLISRATVDQLGEPARGRAMLIGEVQMKGKEHAVEAWALPPLDGPLDSTGCEDAA